MEQGYDQAGDVTIDVGAGNQYLYDGDGRICAVASPNPLGGTTLTGYLYDAEGTRVAKGNIAEWSCDPATSGLTGSTTTNDYILGLSGEQFTEMGVDANHSLVWQHTNVWAGGKLLATYDGATVSGKDETGGLHFYFDDPLGSRRVQTDYAGNIEKTCSSLPYGDAESCAPTPTENLFTGKERDAESGNDYFGARYYSSAMGRFMSPDWSAKREPVPYAKLDNPQSLNLYAYVFNNPLSHIDADGHATWFDPKGKKIGTDGVNDGGVVIAQRNSVAFSPDHSIIDMAASGTPMYSFSKEEIGAMKDSVARTLAPSTTGDMKGGFHEEGFTEKGGVITPAPAGPGYKPGDSEAHVNLPIGPSTTLEEHTHPSGSDATFGGTKFDPMPSGPDMRNAANAQFLSTTDITHVQVSAANSDVHVYTGSGVQATFNLSGAP